MCFLEDPCLIPVSVEGLELDSNSSVAARPLCLSDQLKVQDYETLLVYLWVAISKVCSEMGRTKASQWNSVSFILLLYMDFPKLVMKLVLPLPKRVFVPPTSQDLEH